MSTKIITWVILFGVLASAACKPEVKEMPSPGIASIPQPPQRPETCRPCHLRQYQETLQSTMSGYRAISPAVNALELAGNFLAQGALEAGAIESNLRPLYGESSNVLTSTVYETADQIRSGFCISCHAPGIVLQGEDPNNREIPSWQARRADPDPACGPDNPTACFRPIVGARPLRDFHLIDENGQQVLPDVPGGAPPPGARPSLGAHSVSCDVCHCVKGPELERGAQSSGFANNAQQYDFNFLKVGPFNDPTPIGGDPSDPTKAPFHGAVINSAAIDYLRSSEFCISCHDVRIPNTNVVVPEGGPGIFRLENLGSEWRSQDYATDNNPFGAPVRCQDCHMSLYPYGGESSYEVQDALGNSYQVSSPTPSVFPRNKAASGEDPTGVEHELPERQVVTHYLTGVDVPLVSDQELRARLGEERPSSLEPGVDEHGLPLSIHQRREDLLKASLRIYLDRTDPQAALGQRFNVRVTAVALTGHNFPAGFSQERTTWIELRVTANQRGSTEPFVLYQSGYLVDKAHPETGELQPDGNLHDEDLEHLHAVVNPFNHNNEIFELGPDTGPLTRIFEGEALGLVLFRNELIRVYGPEMLNGKPTGIPAGNRRHPRTGEMLIHPYEEETFSAGAANAVDNWRSLAPLQPRTFKYAIELPSAQELAELGVELEGELQISARVHFQHFPPLFMRFLARVSGSVPYALPEARQLQEGFDVSLPGFAEAAGRRGPADYDFKLFDEKRIDDYLRIVRDIAAADLSVPLGGQ